MKINYRSAEWYLMFGKSTIWERDGRENFLNLNIDLRRRKARLPETREGSPWKPDPELSRRAALRQIKNKRKNRTAIGSHLTTTTPQPFPTAKPPIPTPHAQCLFSPQSVSEEAARNGLWETLILHSGRALFLHPLSHQEMEFNIQKPHHAAASRLRWG